MAALWAGAAGPSVEVGGAGRECSSEGETARRAADPAAGAATMARSSRASHRVRDGEGSYGQAQWEAATDID